MSGIFDKYLDKLSSSSRPRRLSSSRSVNTRSDNGFLFGRSSFGNIYEPETGAENSLGKDDSSLGKTPSGGESESSDAMYTEPVITAPNVRTQYSWSRIEKPSRRSSK